MYCGLETKRNAIVACDIDLELLRTKYITDECRFIMQQTNESLMGSKNSLQPRSGLPSRVSTRVVAAAAVNAEPSAYNSRTLWETGLNLYEMLSTDLEAFKRTSTAMPSQNGDFTAAVSVLAGIAPTGVHKTCRIDTSHIPPGIPSRQKLYDRHAPLLRLLPGKLRPRQLPLLALLAHALRERSWETSICNGALSTFLTRLYHAAASGDA